MTIKRQFLIFVGVGITSAIFDVTTMESLIRLGIHYGIATSLGFIVGLIVNYGCHARITFRATSSFATLVRFGMVVLMNYLTTMAFVICSQHWLGSALIGKVASLPFVAVNGYLWARCWVFK